MQVSENCKLVIFDLDDTLISIKDHKIKNEQLEILKLLKKNNIKIAVASLNTEADQILRENYIRHYFDIVKQRNLSSDNILDRSIEKIYMLNAIIKELNIPSTNILFFDDQFYHCEEARSLRIRSVKVNDLVTWKDIKSGMDII